MSGGASVDTTSSGTVTYLRVSGAIDGGLEPSALRDAALTPVAVLNLRGVDKITNAGARNVTMKTRCPRPRLMILLRTGPGHGARTTG